MADERSMRTCSKTACRWPAAASLSYRYDTRQAWLVDLSEEPDPSLYDLCPHHADTLVVMRGWTRVDERTHAEPVVEPAGKDLLPESGHPPVGAAGYGGNRYRALVEDLPRLAALVAEGDDEAIEAHTAAGTEPVAADEGASPQAAVAGTSAAATGREGSVPSAVPRPSRDLAPLPLPEVPPAAAVEPTSTPPARPPSSGAPVRAQEATAVTNTAATGAAADEVPGQLAIPVPDDEPAIGEAVVVSINSGRRRVTADR